MRLLSAVIKIAHVYPRVLPWVYIYDIILLRPQQSIADSSTVTPSVSISTQQDGIEFNDSEGEGEAGREKEAEASFAAFRGIDYGQTSSGRASRA